MSEEKYIRPTWDEYFMDLAHSVSKRATCDRGRAGCVIVRDKQILVTGYVGSPVGLPHCDDVGHLMKKVVHEDGSKASIVFEQCMPNKMPLPRQHAVALDWKAPPFTFG